VSHYRQLRATASLALFLLAQPAFSQGQSEPAPPADEWRVFIKSLFRPETLFDRLGTAVLILIIAIVAYYLAMHALARTIRQVETVTANATSVVRQRSQRALTMLSLLQSVVRWVIVLAVILWLLAAAGVNIGPVLAGAGIVGVAVGFGAQALVKDVIAGFFILLEGQYAVGDLILTGGVLGVVRAVGLRTTILESPDARVHYIPNGAIVQVTVFEHPRVQYLIDVPLAEAADADRAAQVLAEMASELVEAFPIRLTEMSLVDSRETSGELGLVRLQASALPDQDWLMTEEIPARISSLLKKLEIAVPEGRTPRAFVSFRAPKPVGANGAPNGNEHAEERPCE
jgi:small conductance mechanosensitive channel